LVLKLIFNIFSKFIRNRVIVSNLNATKKKHVAFWAVSYIIRVKKG